MPGRAGEPPNRPRTSGGSRRCCGSAVHANRTQWPLSIATRHPTGLTGLNINPFQVMIEAGSPDGSAALDPEFGRVPAPATAEAEFCAAGDGQEAGRRRGDSRGRPRG
ncbi:chondroitinase family polysaccharide lyase [Micromonospora yasonensis]|uniref:chondroitinase family polysaccharide lyase n=1 Tax=Micromonospora yasonensis TaxID=1128667 RepID=UPI003872AE54